MKLGKIEQLIHELRHERYRWTPVRRVHIPKKNGKLRLVQDYRSVNSWTIKNWYPLPYIPQTINRLRGSELFTCCNIEWGYNKVPIHKLD